MFVFRREKIQDLKQSAAPRTCPSLLRYFPGKLLVSWAPRRSHCGPQSILLPSQASNRKTLVICSMKSSLHNWITYHAYDHSVSLIMILPPLLNGCLVSFPSHPLTNPRRFLLGHCFLSGWVTFFGLSNPYLTVSGTVPTL